MENLHPLEKLMKLYLQAQELYTNRSNKKNLSLDVNFDISFAKDFLRMVLQH